MTNDRLNSQFSTSNSLVDLLPCEYLIFGNSINAQCHEIFIGEMFDVYLTKKGLLRVGSLKLTPLLDYCLIMHNCRVQINGEFEIQRHRKPIENSQVFTLQRRLISTDKKRKELIGIPLILNLSTGKKYQFQCSQTLKLSNSLLFSFH